MLQAGEVQDNNKIAVSANYTERYSTQGEKKGSDQANKGQTKPDPNKKPTDGKVYDWVSVAGKSRPVHCQGSEDYKDDMGFCKCAKDGSGCKYYQYCKDVSTEKCYPVQVPEFWKAPHSLVLMSEPPIDKKPPTDPNAKTDQLTTV